MLSLLSPPFKGSLTSLPGGQIEGIACFSVYKQDLQRTPHNRILVVVIYYVPNSLLYHLGTYIETLQCTGDKNSQTTTFDTCVPSDLGTLRRIRVHFPHLTIVLIDGQGFGIPLVCLLGLKHTPNGNFYLRTRNPLRFRLSFIRCKGFLLAILDGKLDSSLSNLDYLAIVLNILPEYLSLILVHFCGHLSRSNLSATHPLEKDTLKIIQVHRVKIFLKIFLKPVPFKPSFPLPFPSPRHKQQLQCDINYFICICSCKTLVGFLRMYCLMFLIIINIICIHSF